MSEKEMPKQITTNVDGCNQLPYGIDQILPPGTQNPQTDGTWPESDLNSNPQLDGTWPEPSLNEEDLQNISL